MPGTPGHGLTGLRKAFLQLNLREADRDVTRFLWLKDIRKPVSPDNLKVFRFCRVPFGVISSPFLLSATIQHHLETTGTPDAQEVLRNTYVDNVIHGKTTIDEAVTHYQSTKSIFAAAGMNIREWSSNSEEVLA